jgi:hypothetical protein
MGRFDPAGASDSAAVRAGPHGRTHWLSPTLCRPICRQGWLMMYDAGNHRPNSVFGVRSALSEGMLTLEPAVISPDLSGRGS